MGDAFARDKFAPIDERAKDGKNQLVRAGDNYASAYWAGDMWAYARMTPQDAVFQLDFEPTEYRVERREHLEGGR